MVGEGAAAGLYERSEERHLECEHGTGIGARSDRRCDAAVDLGADSVAHRTHRGVGAVVDAPPPAPSAPTTAQHITVSKPAPVIPLSRPQVLDLLHHTPDYGPPGGPLGDPSRRTSCLSGLGYPASTPVLGAQPIDIDARPAVLLVIPADTPDKLAVFAVAPHCSAADTGLLASTVVPRA